MRIVTPKRLSDFAKKHPASKIPLLHWHETVKDAQWNSLKDIKDDFQSVDYIGNNRYVFNIKGNNFRLVAIIIIVSKKVYIGFIGTHAEYDKIIAKLI